MEIELVVLDSNRPLVIQADLKVPAGNRLPGMQAELMVHDGWRCGPEDGAQKGLGRPHGFCACWVTQWAGNWSVGISPGCFSRPPGNVVQRGQLIICLIKSTLHFLPSSLSPHAFSVCSNLLLTLCTVFSIKFIGVFMCSVSIFLCFFSKYQCPCYIAHLCF